MPSWTEQLKSWVSKSFRLGPAVVEASAEYWGKDPEVFSPEAYAEYLATSTGVYACATLRAENLASVPLRLYKGQGDDREAVTTGALYGLLAKVNPFWTLPFLIEMTELALNTSGKAFWVLERGTNGRGTPTEIWWAKPSNMRVVPHPTNYLEGFVYEQNGERLPFAPDEVIWFRNPNPIDEYEGLSPIAAARLSIDLGTAGLRSNKKIFENGSQVAGVVSPLDKDAKMSPQQADDLRAMINKRLKGEANAHRLAVLNHAVKIDAVSLSPKDAEFLGQMRWSLGDVCRVYKVSPILVQDLEHATYSNFDQALKALYVLCLIPQARRIEGVLNEQLLPLFPGEADSVEFDFSGVAVLQEAEDSKWTREQGQIQADAITINEWRKSRGMPSVPWGDGPMGEQGGNATRPIQETQDSADLPPDDGTAKSAAQRALAAVKALQKQVLALGSDEHKTAWKKFDRRATRHEKRFQELVTGLFEQQRDAILVDLQAQKAMGPRVDQVAIARKAIDPTNPFNLEEWRAFFMAAAAKRIEEMAQDAGDSVLDELSIGISFDVTNPEVSTFIQERAQRFAEEVNATTYERLKASMVEATDAGETIDEIAARVEQVMGDRIRSSAETIARTETIGALNGGALEAAKQSGVIGGKTWIATFDGRERDSHSAAHERYQAQPIPLEDDFEVGGARGPAPGNTGDPGEDCNCRCTIGWVLKESGKAIRSETLEAIAEWARKSAS